MRDILPEGIKIDALSKQSVHLLFHLSTFRDKARKAQKVQKTGANYISPDFMTTVFQMCANLAWTITVAQNPSNSTLV